MTTIENEMKKVVPTNESDIIANSTTSEKGANNPTSEKQRFAILDVLRGLALMGIALATYGHYFAIRRS